MKKNEIEKRLKEYWEALKSMETERWVAEFAEDARVDDPVGKPPVVGHDQLRAYFNVLRQKTKHIEMTPDLIIVSPPEAAVKFTGQAITKDDFKVNYEGISMYKFRDDGKLLEMRAFVDFGRKPQ
jgi:steroid Delta-isomerase